MSVFKNPELKHSPVEEKAWIEAMEDVQGGKSLTRKYGTRELFTPAKAQKFMSEKCDKELCPDCDDTYITVISIKSRVRSPFTGHHDWPAPQQQGQKQVVSDNPWLDQGGGLPGLALALRVEERVAHVKLVRIGRRIVGDLLGSAPQSNRDGGGPVRTVVQEQRGDGEIPVIGRKLGARKGFEGGARASGHHEEAAPWRVA